MDDLDLIPLYSFDSNTIPQNLQISQLEIGSFHLTWNPVNTLLFSEYKISKAFTDDLVYCDIGRTTNDSFIVSGLDSQRQYFFTVQTVLYDSGVSIPAGALGSMILGSNQLGDGRYEISGYYNSSYQNFAPQNVNVLNDSNNNYLSWSITTGIQVSGYRIWRSDKWDSQLNSIGSTKNTNYTDSGLNNQTYYYRISSLY